MGKRKHPNSIKSTRARQQELLSRLRQYFYVRDTYGIKVNEIKSFILIPNGRDRLGNIIYSSRVTMEDGSVIDIDENIKDLVGLL